MLVEEAKWLAGELSVLKPAQRLLNLGSSTHHFRTIDQPHIDRLVFSPLSERGVSVTHVDLKQAPGVDVVADLSRESDLLALAAERFDCVLCSNLLEHVLAPEVLAARIGRLVATGGLLVVTVPHRFPHHGDPLDTMFRPNVDELVALFEGTELISSAILESASSFAQTLAARPRLLALNLVRLALPWYKPATWFELVKYLPKSFLPYQVSCIVLRRK